MDYMRIRKSNEDELYTLIEVAKITNADSIKDVFYNAYDNPKRREYRLFESGYLIRRTKDQAAKYLLEHKELFDRFVEAETRLERDKIYTAIFIHDHPEWRYLIENYPGVDITELLK